MGGGGSAQTKFKLYKIISYNLYFPFQNNVILFNQITKIHVFDNSIYLFVDLSREGINRFITLSNKKV